MSETNAVITEYLDKIGIAGLKDAINNRRYLSECEPEIIEVKDEEHIVHTACRACIANCGVIAHVRNGQVVKLEGDPVDPMSKGRMCGKGLSGINALYHPNR
ncbi:MAG: molybdopterin oxidoreductase, partial [Lachnospiraceae bacterium]|nr:molybdopterin oxidoreductase [Lachnospiraceae bacterium]